MAYFYLKSGQLKSTKKPPAKAHQLGSKQVELLPPLITELHQALHAWGAVGLSPGPITPQSFWFQKDGTIGFEQIEEPKPLNHVGLGPDLAAWLVLLDKLMETFVVVARARTVWSVSELGGALGFLTPAFLPAELVQQEPDNWLRVAQAVSAAIADGPLSGTETGTETGTEASTATSTATNQHWNGQTKT